MKIAFYSGSFNPIHNGHLALARYVLQVTDCEEVWLSVTPNNPLKQHADLWPTDLRVRLAALAVQNEPSIRLTDIEQHLPIPSYTLHTLQALTKQFPQHEFCLLIGSDNMARFQEWYKWEEILKHYQLIVYPREGDDMQQLKQAYPQMQVLDNAPLMPYSSTEIRERIQRGESIRGLLPELVENALFREKTSIDLCM